MTPSFSEEIREALSEPTNEILEAIRTTLERTPPELAADLSKKGMILAGGGALLKGLDELIGQETGLPVHIAEDPLTAVALGLFAARIYYIVDHWRVYDRQIAEYREALRLRPGYLQA